MCVNVCESHFESRKALYKYRPFTKTMKTQSWDQMCDVSGKNRLIFGYVKFLSKSTQDVLGSETPTGNCSVFLGIVICFISSPLASPLCAQHSVLLISFWGRGRRTTLSRSSFSFCLVYVVSPLQTPPPPSPFPTARDLLSAFNNVIKPL